MNNEKYEISIVCCYYNEINILKKKFEKFISDRKKFNFSNEIIIADNNSSDGTADFLSEIANQNIENLKGQDADYNATKIIDIFSGSKNEFYEAVCLNSAAALIISKRFDKFEDGYEFSKIHIESGKALTHLKKIQTF